MWARWCWPGSRESLANHRLRGAEQRSGRRCASHSGHIHETVASPAHELLPFQAHRREEASGKCDSSWGVTAPYFRDTMPGLAVEDSRVSP